MGASHPFSGIKTAPTLVYLPGCPYDCGKMLLTDEGYMCPICGRIMNYPKGNKNWGRHLR